jgi:hypothetical protein
VLYILPATGMTGTGMTDLNQLKTFQGHFTDQGYKMTFLLNGAVSKHVEILKNE